MLRWRVDERVSASFFQDKSCINSPTQGRKAWLTSLGNPNQGLGIGWTWQPAPPTAHHAPLWYLIKSFDQIESLARAVARKLQRSIANFHLSKIDTVSRLSWEHSVMSTVPFSEKVFGFLLDKANWWFYYRSREKFLVVLNGTYCCVIFYSRLTFADWNKALRNEKSFSIVFQATRRKRPA